MTATESPPQFDAEAVKRDFPILATQARGRPLVYLDNAATAQKPQVVIDAISRYYCESNANVHRSVHYLAERATTAYETARARVGEYVNAASPECVVWVRGTTEAINLVAAGWGDAHVKEGDRILVTEMEHHSNLVPWQMLAQRTGAKIRAVEVTPDGRLDPESLAKQLDKGPRILAFTAKSNVLGTENDVAAICAQAREAGALTVVDGAQALPHGPVDFQALGCDFLAFSSHKALGPMGVGALVGRPERLEEMGPYQGGGEMILKVEIDKSSYKEAPLRWEAGTPSVADAIGFHVALDYLEGLDPAAIHAHETRLTALAVAQLDRLGIQVFGPDDMAERAGIVSFKVPDVHPHDVAQLLDGRGVAVRAGHHCAQPLMRRLGVLATARASFYVYNTEADVKALVDGLSYVLEYFRR